MTGWRTVLIGFLIAVGPSALTYLAGIDWTQYVSANVATIVAGSVTILMRLVTTTPVGKS